MTAGIYPCPSQERSAVLNLLGVLVGLQLVKNGETECCHAACKGEEKGGGGRRRWRRRRKEWRRKEEVEEEGKDEEEEDKE